MARMQRTRWIVALAFGALACALEERSAAEDGEGTGVELDDTGIGVEAGDKLDVPPGGESQGGDEAGACTADLAGTTLQPVVLGVAFDVSGSMGKLDEPWHDPMLKWEPVVAATKSFFADPTSMGFSATMTFFPHREGKCEADSYRPPDVAVTDLPSDAFADAIDARTPATTDDWIGGTPTLAVTQATLGMLDEMRTGNPAPLYVFVLITDGYPQGCDAVADDIESTVAAVEAMADRVPTYVIGVQNPPGGPDTVTNLESVAMAGGSEHAFIIETGDPETTAMAFKEAIESIREQFSSCSLVIPEAPPGQTFDPEKINVSYDGMQLGYDPECTLPNSWRYDDPANPTRIELCEGTCEIVLADEAPDLVVEFGCDTNPAIP
jgi:hypothetical protein